MKWQRLEINDRLQRKKAGRGRDREKATSSGLTIHVKSKWSLAFEWCECVLKGLFWWTVYLWSKRGVSPLIGSVLEKKKERHLSDLLGVSLLMVHVCFCCHFSCGTRTIHGRQLSEHTMHSITPRTRGQSRGTDTPITPATPVLMNALC